MLFDFIMLMMFWMNSLSIILDIILILLPYLHNRNITGNYYFFHYCVMYPNTKLSLDALSQTSEIQISRWVKYDEKCCSNNQLNADMQTRASVLNVIFWQTLCHFGTSHRIQEFLHYSVLSSKILMIFANSTMFCVPKN